MQNTVHQYSSTSLYQLGGHRKYLQFPLWSLGDEETQNLISDISFPHNPY